MTVSHRKSKPVAKAEDSKVAEPGTRYHCDVCAADITLTVRIRCAEGCEDFDLCGTCFCNGAELGKHKASHAYRVVQQASYPIFCDEWGADEELLLLDGCQIYGLGNWADIADHIGNRSKEEVEQHYLTTYVEGKDGTPAGDERAKKEEARLLEEQRNSSTSSSIPGSMDSRSLYARADVPLDPVTGKAKVSLPPNLNKPGSKPPACGGQLPVVGPNVDFQPSIDADEFQKRKRRRIDAVRDASVASAAKAKAAASAIASGGTPLASTSTPKPLVSAPTSHSELAGYMPGRLEFEFEYEQEAENLVKDMEFGKIYKWGGEDIPGDEILLEEKRKGKQKEVEPGQEGGDVSMEDGERKPTDGNETSRPPITASSRSAAPPPGAASEGSVAAAASSSSKDPSASSSTSNTATATAPEPPPPVQHPNPAAPLADPDDKAPDWDEDPADLQLKLEVLDMYNERLDRRARKKEFVLERRLVEMKKNQALEKRKPKDERDLLTRVKHFAQMQNALNFDEFFNGLVHEEALRRAAAQLQACRKAGLTSLSEVAVYEAEKVDRAKRAAALAEGGFAAAGYALGFPGAQASSSGPRAAASSGNAARARARETSGTPQAEDSQALSAAPVSTAHKRRASNVEGPKTPRKPPRPLDISQHDSLRHLTPKEQICCSEQRILPNSFLVMKKEIIVEYLRRNGDLTRRDARTLFKMDVNKVGKVYDLLADEGYLAAASRGWNPADGIGVPPGHSEENSLGKTDSLRALLQGANGAISPMTASIAKSLDLKVRTPAEASQQQLQQKANSKNKEESLGISSIHRERTSSISSPLTQTPLNADPPSPGQPLPHQAPPQQQQQHHLSQSHLPNGTTPPHPQINVNPQ